MWGNDNDYTRSEVRTWYCTACSKPIRRESIKASEKCKCGNGIFRLQPKLHSSPSLWDLTPYDINFLHCQKIDPEAK